MNKSDITVHFKNEAIGITFTPLTWAEFAIETFDLFNRWMSGKTILDPTMGEGNLLESLIAYGLKKGFTKKQLPIKNLYGIELNSIYFNNFFTKIREKYDIKLPQANYSNNDIISNTQNLQADIIFGNPPWCNFTDLPPDYKAYSKKFFFDYDLIGNARDLLLGGSRVDFAALVIKKTIEKNLKPHGEAIFFMPLSLFLNDGANKQFRNYKVNQTLFSVRKVFDFGDNRIFFNVSTRYGLVHFQRDKEQLFPVPYQQWKNEKWEPLFAKPIFHPNDAWSILSNTDCDKIKNAPSIHLKKESTPRQGINTCGANACFFFNSYQDFDAENCVLGNQTKVILPKKYIFPLADGKNFKTQKLIPQKWVFLPYEQTGKPLELSQINENQYLRNYLFEKKEILQKRKGLLINAWISKGYWWALMGVGSYSFAPYKLIWEAYGKHSFDPIFFSGEWQANQSLQAFIPFTDLDEALQIQQKLKSKTIELYLRSMNMGGTMNWAQPGKIKKFIKFQKP